MRLHTLAALFAVSLLALPAAAQEQRGSILGVVTDASGAVLPGVTVEARSPSVVGVNHHRHRRPGQLPIPRPAGGHLPGDREPPGVRRGVGCRGGRDAR